MNGRREKARQGGWNGGVAKYLNLQGIKKVPRQNAIQMIIS